MTVFGLMPAIQMARHDPQEALRADARGSTAGAGRGRARSVLTIAEVAVSVALLIGAGLLMRSFSRLQQVQPGFEIARTMTARVSLPNATYQGGAPEVGLLRSAADGPPRAAGHRERRDLERPAALGRLHRRRRQAPDPDQRRGGVDQLADRQPRLLRRARHSAARARVHGAGRREGAARSRSSARRWRRSISRTTIRSAARS